VRRSLPTLLLLLLVVLVACGDGDSSGAPNGSTTTMDGGMDGMDHDEHDEGEPPAEGARRVEVEARSFAFTPSEITVAAGEEVAIVLSSRGAFHDFMVEGLDAHASAEAGETDEARLVAAEPGRYTYFCSVPGHRQAGMEGTLVVE